MSIAVVRPCSVVLITFAGTVGWALVPACTAAEPDAPVPTDAGSGAQSDTAAPTDAPRVARDSAPDASPADGAAIDTGAMVSADGGTRYGTDGPVGYTTAALSVTHGSDSFTVNVWVPSTSGKHPVVSFSPGLEQPCEGYTPYATRLASWGFVVLMRSDPGILVSGDTVASDLSYTVGTWLPAQSTMSGSPLYGKADLSHVGLAGHSRGGQTTLVAAEEGLHGKVEAWVGLDPVNTAYSAGTAPSTDLPTIGSTDLVHRRWGSDELRSCRGRLPDPMPSAPRLDRDHRDQCLHPQFEDRELLDLYAGLLPMGRARQHDGLDDAIRYLTASRPRAARRLLGGSAPAGSGSTGG